VHCSYGLQTVSMRGVKSDNDDDDSPVRCSLCLRKSQRKAKKKTRGAATFQPSPPEPQVVVIGTGTGPPLTDPSAASMGPNADSTTPNPSQVLPILNPYLKKPKTVFTSPAESTIPPSLAPESGEIHSFVVPTHVDGGSSINDIALFFRQSPNLFTDQAFVTRIRATNFAPSPHLTATQRLVQ
jgi:hypothetical protein